MLTSRQQKGFSLIEVLIAMSISLIIIVAVLGLLSRAIQTSQEVLEKGKLDRDLHTIMDIIVSDLQRAGYFANADAHYTNPFTTGSSDIAVTSDCILFTYDQNTDGAVQDTEKYGYRFNSTNKTIQFRPIGSNFSCSSPTDWTDLTDPNLIAISAFSVTPTTVPVTITNGSTNTTSYRSVTVTLSGNLTNEPAVTKTLTRTIKVYNNKFQT